MSTFHFHKQILEWITVKEIYPGKIAIVYKLNFLGNDSKLVKFCCIFKFDPSCK